GTFLLHKVGYPVGSWFAKRVVSAQRDSAGNVRFDSLGNALNVLCDNGKGGAVACATAPAVYLGRTIPNVEGALSPAVTLWNRLRFGALLDFKTGYKKLNGNTRVRCTIFLGGSRGGNFSAWEQADLPQLAQWIVTVNVGY